MAKLIKVPVLGQSVEEVRILQWFKNEGDRVEAGERLAEIETDKTAMEWESPEAGVVRRILAPVDSYVKVEAPLVVIGTADEPIDDLVPGASGGEPQPVAAPSAVASNAPVAPPPASAVSPLPRGSAAVAKEDLFLSPRARRAADKLGVDLTLLTGRGTGPRGRVQEKDVLSLHEELLAAATTLTTGVAGRGPRASPLARAVANEAGLDLSALSGTGLGGRITAGDVRSAAEPPAAPELAVATTTGTRTVTLTGLRKRVADNIARSVRTSPHVTLNLQVDMGASMQLRKDLLPAVEKASGGIRLSPTDIIIKACAVALREFPYVNTHIEGDTMTLFEAVHVGLAVSLGEAGLIVPVIKDVHRKGFAEIARDRQDLATRARDGKLTGPEVTGGTFTVTNLGNFGIESFNPVINPPQVAILGVGTIADAVVARGGVPTVRPMMGLSLSFDHRAMDGAPAAAFLARVKEILETPSLLLV